MVDFQDNPVIKGEEYVTLWSNDGQAFTVKVDILKQSPTFDRMLSVQLRDKE
jgi:dTDP-4-dehydrorhamnose 3,5-epimerase-like enzyme